MTTSIPMNPTEKKAIEYCLDHDSDHPIDSTNELSFTTDVCRACEGTGITWNGVVLFQSDFDEDPFLHESVMDGAFDRPCEECGGNKVLRYIDWDSPQTHSVRQVKKMLEDIWESRALDAAERRAGC